MAPAFRLYFTAPVRMRDVLFAKNLTHTVLLAIEVTTVLLLTIFLYGPPDPRSSSQRYWAFVSLCP